MKDKNSIKIINGNEISHILNGKEIEIVNLVEETYRIHHDGDTMLPHSIFLRFPERDGDRIIGLPAYIGGNKNVAGIKWIASFPHNITKGLERASATLILNSMKTGHPKAVLECSVISAKRTAASAALAAKYLMQYSKNNTISLIGCGLIGYETIRFIKEQVPNINKWVIFDLNIERAEEFKNKIKNDFLLKEVEISSSLKSAIDLGGIIILATTAPKPYINEVDDKSILLNISLRDISPEIIKDSVNIFDDFDHVNKAETSIHLATQKYGCVDSFHGTITDLIKNKIDIESERKKPIIFSPFGLGVLDIALGEYCYEVSNIKNIGYELESFLPKPWNS